MSRRLQWERDGRDWPNRHASRFVKAAGLRWHVQQLGTGPAVLLLHGTGAATHSWRGLAPLLARHFTVVAPDLPGHGFTDLPPSRRLSLPGMAEDVAALLHTLSIEPLVAVGHSAGAAVLARMALDSAIAPRALASLNGALLPLSGVPGRLFPPMAKLLAATPLVPRVFAWRAGERAAVERLIRSTGSALEPAGTEYYARLVRSADHVGATLAMMANWDLRPLQLDLPRLRVPLTLVVGTDDRTVPPSEARRAKALVPSARIVTLPGLGHLAHEERPEAVAELLFGIAREARLLR
ncbi:MAG: alpha/beta fold hydrolase BchO [Pseudomonadota bacterium]